MKRLLMFVAVFLCMAPAFAEKVSQSDIDGLINSRLTCYIPMGHSAITLMKNNRYSMELGSPGPDWRSEGRYELKNSRLLLHPEKCYDGTTSKTLSPDCGNTMGEAVATLDKSDSDLYFSKYLVIEAADRKKIAGDTAILRFGLPGTKVTAGSRRSFDGINVITMGMQMGVVTANAKIRLKPSTQARSMKYLESPYGPGSLTESVPAGTSLKVKARTVEKDKVGQWNNYWYLVDVGMCSDVWIFGELVKLK